ncbi:alpha-1,4-glucan:maltose-1-phosphate maltosyltransferase 2 [Cnuibacter physcomitrellae]|uniref:alpha-1,4-glucan--maltose-1-phosphate maltosyltransferase n=1 Tax=Cnuibacter physcomitrellae TaxID=1619308 RepID=UPI00198E3C08|nr:alpha-1,4-glucan--maltose-1-phosphate maltosyltransferase [Cnuibacter physcomitrellae]GGI41716.1 alpha-1,4-glucan:maltose-1-phosphate maltosyltransferase 2 [Cnuibacter physcomitrellae]
MARVSESEQLPSFSPAIGRIPILDEQPVVDGGRWPAKAYAGEVLPFSATVFREGHDAVGAHLELESPAGVLTDVPLARVHSWDDRYRALAQVTSEGPWRFRIRAFSDDFATWEHNATIKIANGVDVELMFTIGAELFKRLSKEKGRPVPTKALFKTVSQTLSDKRLPVEERLAPIHSEEVASALTSRPAQSLVTYSEWHPLVVERARAGVGAWYELFPRSVGAEQAADGTWTSGTLRSAAERLPAVAAMGFDVVYLPPVHPIGSAFRKGRNNTLDPQPGDPGSPWAIGGAAGGHDAIHPDLGTQADFAEFVAAAAREGLEVAMDFALQASPDHPWVTEHPEWFTTLPDGSIAYAENPPKKYQDIYPINFDNDPEGIRQEALRILLHWIAFGVRIFRVDNPHTKPVDFWEWVIHEVNRRHPDVVFLAEAFTRPAMMQTLGKVGFQQSYSYFTWRNTKEELTEFFEMLGEWAPYYRANLFVNTPDILTEYLQFGGRPAYEIRAILAATASPSWGVYSGYELVENVARPGSEENIDNEKYEYKPRDFAAAEAAGTSLAPLITRLNAIRREHASLRDVRTIDVHWSDDDAVLVYSKHLDARFAPSGESDTVLVVVNTDPHSVRETTVHLDPTRFGLEADSEFTVRDLLTGQEFVWGQHDYVRLDSFTQPAHILHVQHERGDD